MSPPIPLPASSINRQARLVGRAPDSMQHLARTVILQGAGREAELQGKAGLFNVTMGDYSVPIVPFDSSMIGKRINGGPGVDGDRWYWAYNFPAGWSYDQATQGNVAPGARVPMNDSLKAGTGQDQIVLLEDLTTGQVWNYWTFRQIEINALHPTNVAAGVFSKTPRLVNGGTNLERPFGSKAVAVGDRGAGLPKRALVTTLAEILTGVVRHAAELTICNSWYVDGDDANAGVAGVDYLAPATRCEWDEARSVPRRQGVVTEAKDRLVPEGLRIAWPDLPWATRTAWVNDHFPAGRRRQFWTTLVGQWAVYGLVVAETGNFGMHTELDGIYGYYRNADGKIVPTLPAYQAMGWDLAELEAQEFAASRFMLDFIDEAVVIRPTP